MPLPTFTTANALTPKERSERVRTTRKLAQLFGQPPGVPLMLPAASQEVHLSNGCMPLAAPLSLNLSAKRKPHLLHRPADSEQA